MFILSYQIVHRYISCIGLPVLSRHRGIFRIRISYFLSKRV